MPNKTFQIRDYKFNQQAVNCLALEDHLEENWPVVYQIYNNREIYIGETTNLKNRMNQHLANEEKSSLRQGAVKVIFDETFNKSAALDLESYLIQYFSGDGKFKVLNRNDGMCDRDYYNRARTTAKPSKKSGTACANSKSPTRLSPKLTIPSCLNFRHTKI